MKKFACANQVSKKQFTHESIQMKNPWVCPKDCSEHYISSAFKKGR
jgi:hypothetical protein